MSRMIRKPEDLPVIDVLVVVLSEFGALLSMLCTVRRAGRVFALRSWR